MKSALVSFVLMFVCCSVSYAQAPERSKAVEECRAEQGGTRIQQAALTACVQRKMEAARGAGKAPAKTGEACKFSTGGNKC